MISYLDALNIIAEAVEPLPAVRAGLDEMDACATASVAVSHLAVPPSNNSAMDGFAVRAADTANASRSQPLVLDVVGSIAAGDRPATAPLGRGAVEIMTGAPIPPGCDGIVPVEQVETVARDGDKILSIRIHEPVQEGRHVRLAGQDFVTDAAVLADGRLIEPHEVMGLAATGTDTLNVRRAPRFSVITTGSELATSGKPAHAGLIRDSNGPYSAAFVRRIGGTLALRRHAPDTLGSLEKVIAESGDADIVLTTGGVSAGRFDLVPDAVTALDGEILFHKVAIRPGKPILFARLPGGKLFFGLPGNPISVAVGLRFFVVPAARMLQGLPPEQFNLARNVGAFRKPEKLYFFGKAHAKVDAEGRIEARLLQGQESFRIGPLLKSNCWAIVEAGRGGAEAGELIRLAPLYPTQYLQ